MNINKLKEIVMKYVFLFTAIISIVAVVLICVFLFANGVPAMKEIGFANFLGGTKWKPGNGLYGIFPGKYLCNRRSLDHRSTNRNSDVYLHGTFLSGQITQGIKTDR